MEEIEAKRNNDELEDGIEIFKYQRVYYHKKRHSYMKERNKKNIKRNKVEMI